MQLEVHKDGASPCLGCAHRTTYPHPASPARPVWYVQLNLINMAAFARFIFRCAGSHQ